MLGFEKNYTLIKNSKETFCAVPKLLGHRTAVQRETCIAWPAHLSCYNFVPSPKPIHPLTNPSHEQSAQYFQQQFPGHKDVTDTKILAMFVQPRTRLPFPAGLAQKCLSMLFCSQVLQLKVACGLGNLTCVYVSVFQFVWDDICAQQ